MRAFEIPLKMIETIERLEAFKMAQRESILRQLAVFKQGWLEPLRQAWNRIEAQHQEEHDRANGHSIVPRQSEVDDDISEENRGKSA